MLRFGKEGKLSLIFIGPYDILKRIGPLAYKHIELQSELTYIEQPVKIMDHREQALSNKASNMTRVLWRN